MNELGNLKRLDPRSIWSKEDHDFTPWLAENLDRLGEALGLDLELQSTEAPVGDFSVDILARDPSRDSLVVIENQLGPTDHDHLGKLLTYASGYDATVVVWVTREFRDEHRQALDWLNQHTDSVTHFFGVVVEALQVDDSRPAINFRLVAAPNEWRKQKVGDSATGPASARREAYRSFFQPLVDELREKHRFTNARVAQPQNFYAFASGLSRVYYAASFARGGRCRAEAYLDLLDKDENKRVFDRLANHKQELESQFGGSLTWERLDDSRACRIAVYRSGSIDDKPEELAPMRTWFVENLLQFKRVFGKKIEELVG